jgi:hypothetical protein
LLTAVSSNVATRCAAPPWGGRDIVELLGEHDALYQRRAVETLARILDTAEEAMSESHLSFQERALAHLERRAGKGRADALRARLEAIRRGDFDALDE